MEKIKQILLDNNIPENLHDKLIKDIEDSFYMEEYVKIDLINLEKELKDLFKNNLVSGKKIKKFKLRQDHRTNNIVDIYPAGFTDEEGGNPYHDPKFDIVLEKLGEKYGSNLQIPEYYRIEDK